MQLHAHYRLPRSVENCLGHALEVEGSWHRDNREIVSRDHALFFGSSGASMRACIAQFPASLASAMNSRRLIMRSLSCIPCPCITVEITAVEPHPHPPALHLPAASCLPTLLAHAGTTGEEALLIEALYFAWAWTALIRASAAAALAARISAALAGAACGPLAGGTAALCETGDSPEKEELVAVSKWPCMFDHLSPECAETPARNCSSDAPRTMCTSAPTL